jgi:hypothetical protein
MTATTAVGAARDCQNDSKNNLSIFILSIDNHLY